LKNPLAHDISLIPKVPSFFISNCKIKVGRGDVDA